ncbi:MAG TPA: hypothetical protein VLJ59_18220 [Mycobacteriales bacterium]|nr:hypothetical protein [Mycobacteriales bacterium]
MSHRELSASTVDPNAHHLVLIGGPDLNWVVRGKLVEYGDRTRFDYRTPYIGSPSATHPTRSCC